MNRANLIALAVFAAAYIAYLVILVTVVAKDPAKKPPENRRKKPKFDERQLAAQGRGFRYSFFTMMVYFFLMMIAEAAELKLFEPVFALVLGLVVLCTPYMVISILSNAFSLPRQGKLHVIAVNLNFIALLFLAPKDRGLMIRDGMITNDAVLLACCLFYLLIDIVFVIHYVREKRNPNENTEQQT